MNLVFLLVVGHVLVSNLCCGQAFKSATRKYHPGYRTVNNPKAPPEYDCALRAFAIEMSGFIAPPSWKSNWTTLTESAFQMNQCNSTLSSSKSAQNFNKSFKDRARTKERFCSQQIFVHDAKGNDLFDGTLKTPLKTIQEALLRTRALRRIYGNNEPLCMTIRGGTYYLGTNATTTSSQIGAIALTTNDSNLIIENYQDELVILSGGALLQLQWSVHSKTATDGTIMKAQVPSWVNLDEFNELYIDGRRAIIAKYPNGDPSTQGLYAQNPGFSYDSQSWVPPIFNPSVDIHEDTPYRNGTVFPNYQIGIGGGASVFNPPRNFWSTKSPPAGGNYQVPRGFTVKSGALPHIGTWSKPATGFVHAFHSGYWGSWVFEIASVEAANNKIMFGRGGFQEARGSHDGGAFYVSNIFEELDSPNEWFLDRDTRTLYFMPNQTMPQTFVASQIPCIISVSGSSEQDAAHDVTIRGLTFTETSSTYMKDYMVPSGGDWSVHRGGTVFLINTKNIEIMQNIFTELGSNGIAVIDYNDATIITLNEFVWLGDSAIVLVGSTNGIDGFSVASQPTNTLIQTNIIHETGIYIKQSSPVLVSVSRSVSIIGNVMFNMPRAAININDGFYGNHSINYNVIFNTVRETSDHGPINSWDRQPFLTDAVQSGVPSLWQHTSYIHHNVLFNNYRSVWPIDHDDGSCFYEDSYNFLVYGGKKNYLGHSKTDHHEIYVYPDLSGGGFGSGNCLNDYAPQRGSSGWDEVWINNTCVLYQSSKPYHIENCETTNLFVPQLLANQFYIPAEKQIGFTCKVSGASIDLTLAQWNSFGLDIGSTVNNTPDIQTVIEWGRKMLQNEL